MAHNAQVEGVRPVVADDIPRIADLFVKVFGLQPRFSRQRLQAYFTEILLHHPWRGEGLSSLVYEGTGGRIIGCLGVMPRSMSYLGKPVHVALSHDFMVDPLQSIDACRRAASKGLLCRAARPLISAGQPPVPQGVGGAR